MPAARLPKEACVSPLARIALPAGPWMTLAAVLAGCAPAGGTGSPSDPGPAPEDIAVAAHALVGADSLWIVLVHEEEQGGLDLDGDGDACDDVVHLLDLATGRLSNTGLPVIDVSGQPRLPAIAASGQAAAFAVSEAALNGSDLNGDGDALDEVLHVYDRASGRTTNLGLAIDPGRGLIVGDQWVAFSVSEHDQGGQDLDGDGRADGAVLHVHDARRGDVLNLQLHGSRPLLVADGFVALTSAEVPGLDLNLDGDTSDEAIFQLYDTLSGTIHNTGVASESSTAVYAAGAWGISLSEAAQGQGDLSGDGDADDDLFFFYDPRRGLSALLPIAVPRLPAPQVLGGHVLLLAVEARGAADLNGDGDLADLVPYVFDVPSGLLFATGLATADAAVLVGDWVAVSVSEAMQGSADLDGDGDASGDVVHVLEPATGRVDDLELDARVLLGGARLFLLPQEGAAEIDWNGDGDRLDGVLFDWAPGAPRARNSGGAVGAVIAAAGPLALALVREAERGLDGNGDGDLLDLLLERYDARTGQLQALGVAPGARVELLADGRVLLLVEEQAQGQDLNHDGDRIDQVLSLVR